MFSNFRLKGSYGKVGNVSGIGNYQSLSTFGSGLYGGTSSLIFNNVGNPNLTWETSKKMDVGASFGILNGRVNAEVSYYDNKIDGQSIPFEVQDHRSNYIKAIALLLKEIEHLEEK